VDLGTFYNLFLAIKDSNYCIKKLIRALFFLGNLTFYYYPNLLLFKAPLLNISFRFIFPVRINLLIESNNYFSQNFDLYDLYSVNLLFYLINKQNFQLISNIFYYIIIYLIFICLILKLNSLPKFCTNY
jgi:hypothetical protein